MHPILFFVPTPWGAVPIYSYGVMLGLSLLFAWYFLMYEGKKTEGFNQELLASCFTWTAVGAIVGARLLYVLTNLDSYPTLGSWFNIRSGGLVAYGGFLGGFVTAWAFWRIKKIPLLPFADLIAPTLASGLMMTRIGCYLYGCDYGRPLAEGASGALARAGTFPRWDVDAYPGFACSQTISGSPAYEHHLQVYADQMTDRTASLPVHPTQLYESAAGLALFLLAFWLLNHRKFRGQVFLVVAGLYAVWRFAIEYLRDDPERGFAYGFSTSQLISLALVPACALAYVQLKKRADEHGDAPLPPWALEPGQETATTGEKAGKATKSAAAASTRPKNRRRR